MVYSRTDSTEQGKLKGLGNFSIYQLKSNIYSTKNGELKPRIFSLFYIQSVFIYVS